MRATPKFGVNYAIISFITQSPGLVVKAQHLDRKVTSSSPSRVSIFAFAYCSMDVVGTYHKQIGTEAFYYLTLLMHPNGMSGLKTDCKSLMVGRNNNNNNNNNNKNNNNNITITTPTTTTTTICSKVEKSVAVLLKSH